MAGEPVKKKRGRRPKAEIDPDHTKSDAPIIEDAIPQIINIVKPLHNGNDDSDKNKNESNFEDSFCEYDPTILVPDAYKREDKFAMIPSAFSKPENSCSFTLKHDNNKAWPSKTDNYCMWCCHPFANKPVGIPIKFSKNIFFCTGNFCSFECAVAHNYECNDLNVNTWERFNLLNLMAIKHEVPYPVKCAKPKARLRIFGGSEDIQTFRENNTNLLYYTHSYPMVSATEQVEELGDSFNSNTEAFTIQKDAKNKQTTIQQFY